MLIFFKLVCISWLKSASPFASPHTIIVTHSFDHRCNYSCGRRDNRSRNHSCEKTSPILRRMTRLALLSYGVGMSLIITIRSPV